MNRSASDDEYHLVADLYDSVVPYRDRQDVAFFVEIAQQSQGSVLEIGCGTGRVLIPTARAGVTIAGLDASSSMLAVCRAKLSEESEEVQARVTLAKGDMRSFDLRKRFGLATIPFRPFQHLLTVKDQLACLACIHRHLMDGGRLILDVFNPSLPHLAGQQDVTDIVGKEPEFTMPDGRRVLRQNRIVSRDLVNQVLDIELTYTVTHPDGHGERLVHRLQMRYFFRFEVEHALARTGFQVEAVYSDYDKSPYGSKYPGELVFVARKTSAV